MEILNRKSKKIYYPEYFRRWRELHPHYSRNYYREKVNPYFFLQFFKYILRQQRLTKWCPKGHGVIPKGCYKCPTCLKEDRLKKRLEYGKRKKKQATKSALRSREIRATYQINRKWVIDQLGSKCVRCGFENILALDIHHIISEKKPKAWTTQKKDLFYYWKKQGFIPEEERKNMKL